MVTISKRLDIMNTLCDMRHSAIAFKSSGNQTNQTLKEKINSNKRIKIQN